MGGGVSVSAMPEILTEEQFKTIAGNLYSKDMYDQLKNSDGKITRANLLQELKLEYTPSVDLKIIPWEQLMFDNSAEIGRGSFGYVYQALWVPRANSTTGSKAVAVKLMTRVIAGAFGMKYYDELKRSREEATRVLEIAKRGGEAVADAIIKVHGFAEGPLPAQITSKFKLEPGEEAFGVVMRLEAGGSLDSLLHTPSTHLSMADKMTLICLSVTAIAELHYIGVIHGDLKPANILLTRVCAPWELHVADFGMTEMRELINKTMAQSTMRMTSGGMKGTPMYCAPELILEDDNGDVAKSSRLTDIYALSMLIWEILSRKVPFGALKSIASLTQKLAKGERPPLDVGVTGTLPLDTPPAIVDMIERCWNTDRSKRMFAVEMKAVVIQELAVIEKGEFDVFFSHRWACKAFLSHLHALLTKLGYRVWYDQAEMGWDLTKSMNDGVKRSKVMLACVDKGYQDRPNCMLELRAAKALVDPVKPVVVVLTEGNPTSWGSVVGWANDEMKDLCDFQKKMFVDLSKLAGDPGWKAVDGPSETLLKDLEIAAEPLLKILHDLDCRPSASVSSGVAAMRFMAAVEEREKLAATAAGGAGSDAVAAAVKAKAEQEAKEIKAKAEQEAREIKAKAEQEAKEQAEREAAKVELEAKEIKAKAEREAKEQADRNAATAEIAAMKAEAEREIAEMKAKAEKERIQQAPAKATVRIAGAMGIHAGYINGIYEATTEMSYGMPVYVKVDNADHWLEYYQTNAGVKSWQTKPTAGKGTNGCMAKCFVSANCLPQDCPADQWQVGDGTKFNPQSSITISVVNQQEVDAVFAEVKREAARVVKGSQPVRITGATGPNAYVINGVYKPTEEMIDKLTVYVRVGLGDMLLEYDASAKKWHVKPTASKGTGKVVAQCAVPAKCLPQDCPVGQWLVTPGHLLQPAVTISVATQQKVEAYLAEVEGEAARVVKGSHNVRITGATGTNAGYVNGIYKPTEEMCNTVTVYAKVGDGDTWLEYHASYKQWQVKRTAGKGIDACWAKCTVPAKCLPQDCPAGEWLVDPGQHLPGFESQPTVTISTEVTQEEMASKTKAEQMANEQPKSEKERIQQAPAKATVRIVEATGTNAAAVNGMYEVTTEMSGGMPVYVKVGAGDIWLVYIASSKDWNVQNTVEKGTDSSKAYCAVPAKCLPQDCPVGQWQVADDGKLVPQPAVVISSVVTQQEADAYLAEVKKEAARVVKGSHNVCITGATGRNAAIINGVFKPTEEMCDNATVYVKVGAGDICLVYYAGVKKWQVKLTAYKGKDGGTAECPVPAKCLPQDCPMGQWYVANEDKKLKIQASITISVVTQQVVEVYLAEVEREAARVVKGSHNIRIAGATGPTAAAVNGIYKPTEEMCGKVTAYAKVDDGGQWLEYHASYRRWQLKPTKDKGLGGSWAECDILFKCLPQECPVGQWQVFDGSKWEPQPSITISVV